MLARKFRPSNVERSLSLEEQQEKINEVRKLIGPLSNKLPNFCSDASILRYLKARNWNTKKANIAHEAETGKVYKPNYLDKYGRTNTSSTKGQIKYLVYCLENAISNSASNQEQMVWLIDFQGWNMSSISVKVTRETAHVLQNYYPERLGLAILYNPPKIFESFWTIVKPFIEPKTFKKVKFVYSDNSESQKIMEDLFYMDKLELVFGGRNSVGFDFKLYEEKMREDDRKMSDSLNSEVASLLSHQPSVESVMEQSESLISDPGSESSDEASFSSDVTSLNMGFVDDLPDDKTKCQQDYKDGGKTVAEVQDNSLK
ncbi:random slug protein 5 isoform X4 [Cinnamomum micranthum f. kanehirae]|uniref:Random slug protein 5 isoform X4 n=1 Tax=Cinnamomum micranthum f. kanehirae TaxID=337451 RepID=A0A443NBF8_9MAGN|nr:random slug protein 5 isoform X4 [Cinnamomum micranthum f. kanehirae]